LNLNAQNDLMPVEAHEDVTLLKSLIQRHLKHTGSETARSILLNWERERPKFKKVWLLQLIVLTCQAMQLIVLTCQAMQC
jgi:glutamate synthase domain-containing protein 3